jgi:DNA polymerase IV
VKNRGLRRVGQLYNSGGIDPLRALRENFANSAVKKYSHRDAQSGILAKIWTGPSPTILLQSRTPALNPRAPRPVATGAPSGRIPGGVPPCYNPQRMSLSSSIPALPRTIFHVDMDAFFVSVEELFDPNLKGKAVVVGGQRDERGVVSAASYEARKFGVHSAMPLRTAAKLCPHAIFINGHPERYRDCSQKVYAVLNLFSPQVEMASIDEAYLDMTGTTRLHGPPLKAAHSLHERMKADARLNCSIGIGSSRLIAKVSSAQAKPNGVLWIVPGQEAKFLAPLDVGAIPGVGKVMESNLNGLGIRKVGDLARLEESDLEHRFGKWGLALAGKSRGEDAGGWFDNEVGADLEAKSISHEHTYNEDTADATQLESTLMRLSEMVGRRLREAGVHARTVQLKLRYKDFTTITRAHTPPSPTQLDTEIFEQIRALFHKNWKRGAQVRLLGVQASSFTTQAGQMDLLEGGRQQRWKDALAAADRLRDKFGESSVKLAAGMRGGFRERTHESPVGLPGKNKPKPG